MSLFKSQLENACRLHAVKLQPPLDEGEIVRQLSALAAPSGEMLDFFRYTNGLEKEWFKVFPLEDKTNVKRTWDSIQRANDHLKSSFLSDHRELFERFLVFASIGGGNCALIDRTDGTLWYQDQGLHQTDMSLIDFIEIELKEVSEH